MLKVWFMMMMSSIRRLRPAFAGQELEKFIKNGTGEQSLL
jgi:hypothetical protein